jgi:hypothetical protein
MAGCMIQPSGKAKKIADKILGRPHQRSKDREALKQPTTTYEQAFQQMKYMR